MKHLITAIIFLAISSCFPRAKKLENKVQTIRFHYIAWACECSNWATAGDINKYQDDEGDKLADNCVFIEPADHTKVVPDTVGYTGDIILLTGQYYTEKGFPKGFKTEQPVDKAKVFRYTSYKIIKSNYR